MSGIVGFIDHGNQTNKRKIIKDMIIAISHSDIDKEDVYLDDHVALSMQSIKTIDLSIGPNKLLFNENKSLVMSFTGVIYNYMDLKEDLINKGHIFVTNDDSEVIIHGFEAYREKILLKLRGMFAFAIWDIQKKEIFIARDFFGIKPLYYTRNTNNKSFIFGSQIKCFLKNPAFIKEFNNGALKPYLTFQYSVLDEYLY